MRYGLLCLPTHHVPPRHFVWSNERLLLRGTHLINLLRAGKKSLTTRGWCINTVARFRELARTGRLARVQSSYAYETIVGWALLASVSMPRPAQDVLTAEKLQLAGCAHLSQSEYIYQYISRTDPNPMVVLLVVKRYWPV